VIEISKVGEEKIIKEKYFQHFNKSWDKRSLRGRNGEGELQVGRQNGI
jgi:hypothetical protein